MHFTSEGDIMKIVYPTITKYWGEKIEAANTIANLNVLQLELQGYRVLDPACGSGNFLYLAYQELKRIEVMLLAKLASKQKSSQVQMGLVTPNQFFGMDINPFAVELARVTLTIARKVAIDKHRLSEPALPLDTLDRNIICQDALFTDWVKADAIIGNPPFLGGKRIRTHLGNDYIKRIFAKFPDVKDSVDFCSYWFRIAHDNLNENGRAGLVGTNSIGQGKSRVASIDYIVQNGGYIHDAISTQEWSGEAAVHVSIANWSKQIPRICRLDNKIVSRINSSFQAEIDVSQAARLKSNANLCFTGVTPIGRAFVISLEQAEVWKKANPKSQEIIHPFLEGNDLVGNPYIGLKNWIIDFNDMRIEDASEYIEPFAWVRSQVKPERDLNRRQIYQRYWWQLGERRPAMREALKNLSQYFAVPQTSKWAIFLPCSSEWLPNARTRIVASEDFYILGILTSRLHRIWMEAQMSTLEDRISYTHNTCFETFPFSQSNTKNKELKPLVLYQQIRSTMQELHQYRTEQMESKQWGITKLYNEYFHEPASQLYKLHAKLDKQVMQLYGFSEDDDLLEKLLHLNQEIAAKESS
jgi:SAM-dependent methyltransferase